MEFMDDGFTPEEEARWGDGGFAVPQPPPKRGGGRSRFLLEDDEEEEGRSYTPKMETLEDAAMDPRLANMEFLVDVHRAAERRQVLPSAALSAASTLLSVEGKSFTLDPAMRSALQKMRLAADEFTQVDPPIVLSATLPLSDTCRLFLEETIPFSEYILLRVLKARFVVVVSNKMKTAPISFEDPELELRVTPFEGRDPVGQAFGAAECLQEAARDVDELQVAAHMFSLGKLSPRDVCDQQFIEDQLEVFRDIVSGKLRIVREKKRTKPDAF